MPNENDLLIKGDVGEINAVVARFLPFARAGLTVDQVSDAATLHEFINTVIANPESEEAKRLGGIEQIAAVVDNIDQAAAEFYEYGPLISLQVNHHVESRIQYKLAELAKAFQKDWQLKIDRLSVRSDLVVQQLRDEQITILSDKIKALFKEFDRDHYYDSILIEQLKVSDRLQSPDQLIEFFNDFIKAIQAEDQLNHEKAAILDADQARVNGKQFCVGRSSERVPARLDTFRKELEGQGVRAELAKFISLQFNQAELMRGAHFLLDDIQPILRTLKAGYVVSSYDFTPTDSENSVIMTFENCTFDFGQEGPRELQAKASLQCRFTYFPAKNGPEQFRIELTTTPTLHVTNERARALFLDSRSPSIAAKVRREIGVTEDKLWPHEKRILDQDLAPFLLETKKLDEVKVAAANDKYLFMLMHYKREYAEAILERGLPDQFFNRPPVVNEAGELVPQVDPNAGYIAIENDLVRIKDKHYLSDTVRNETDQYLSWIGIFKRYRESDPVPASSQNKAEIYRSIVAGLSGSGREGDIVKRHLFSAMLSIKDTSFVKDLMSQREIRNRLCSSVLTHFALQDKDTAAKLLEPSWWERTRLKIASFFVDILPQKVTKFLGITTKTDDVLPKDRFTPADLGKIVAKHDDFWDTSFAPGKEAASKLTADEISAIVSSEQTNIVVVNKIRRRDELWDKVKDSITVSDDIRYHTQYPLSSLDALAEIEEDKHHLATFHQNANQEELYNFYYNKFIQGAAGSPLFLIHAIEDIFGLFPKEKVRDESGAVVIEHGVEKEKDKYNRNLEWAYLINQEHNVTPAVKATIKRALIAAVANQWLKVTDLTEDHGFTRADDFKNVENVSVAEVFISNPFTNGFRKNVLPEAEFNELRKALLANHDSFNSLAPQCVFHHKDVEGLAGVFTDANNSSDESESRKEFTKIFRAVFENSNFKALLKSSSELFKELQKVLAHSSVKTSAKSEFYLANLVKELTENEPTGVEGYRSYEVVLRLFGDRNFVEQIKKLQYKDNEGIFYSPLYEQLLNLHTKARFFDAVRKEQSLVMFVELWQKHKADQPTQNDHAKKSTQDFLNLILFVQASQQEKLYNWLQKSSTECRYLIGLLVANEPFRKDFIAKANPETLQLLLLRASNNDLVTLLLQSETLNKQYFDALSAEVLSPKPKDSFEIGRLREIVFSATKYDLALLITSNTQFLKILNEMRVYDSYKEKIDKALTYVNLIMPIEKMAELKNANPATRERIEKLNEKLDIATDKNRSKVKEQKKADNLVISSTIEALLTAVDEKGQPKEVDSKLIKVLLQHRTLLRRLLQNGSRTHIVTIFENISKRKEDINAGHALLADSLLKEFANTILLKGIADPVFWKRVDGDELREQLSRYASPELIARILKTRPAIRLPLSGWRVGLNRVAEDQKLFQTSLPHLQNLENFGKWFFTHAVTQPDAYANAAPLITSQILTSLMESRELRDKDFPRKDFFELFSGQYQNQLFPGEVAIREVLLKSEMARENFRAVAKGHPDTVLALCIQEAKLNPDSPLLTEWLKQPFINYVVENSDVNNIEALVEKFEQLGLKNQKTIILERVIALATANDNAAHRLLNSEKLLTASLGHCLTNQPELARDFLLKMFEDPIDRRFVPYVPKYVGEIVKLLEQPDQGSRLIQFFLQLVNYFNRSESGRSLEQERSALKAVLGNLDVMLMSDIDPSLHQQLFIALFGIFGNEEKGASNDLYGDWLPLPKDVSARDNVINLRRKLFANEALHESAASDVNTKLYGTLVATDTQALQGYLNSLSADQLVDLYCASVALVDSGANPDHVSIKFRDAIKTKFLQDIFLNATGKKVCLLLAKDPNLAHDYMRFAKELPDANPAENIRALKAVAIKLGDDLRSRILFDREYGSWTLDHLIVSLSPSQIALQFEFLASDSNLYVCYLESFQRLAKLFSEFPDLLKANIVEIIKKDDTAADLADVIESFNEVENNPVTNLLRELLMGADSPVRTRFVEYLEDSAELRKAFFGSLGNITSSKDMFELLQRERVIEDLFLDNIEQTPGDLDLILKEDIERAKEDPAAAVAQFREYFLNSPNNRRLYRLLNEAAPDSGLTRIIDEIFEDEQDQAALFLAAEPKMTSVDLAEIINFEANGIKQHTPLTTLILNYGPDFQHMMKELYAVDPKVVYTGPILDQLTYSAARRAESVANAKAVLNNFKDVNPNVGLEFKVDGKVITSAHECLYFYAHHVNFLGEAIRKKDERQSAGHNRNVADRQRTSEFYPDYEQYLKSVNKFVEVTEQGLVFKATKAAVPPELSILYFEALARYLYQPKQEFRAKELLETNRKFADLLSKTLTFDDKGKAQFESRVSTPEAPEGLGTVPVYYSNTALYANACLPDADIRTPNLALAFLQSVTVKDFNKEESKLVFVGITDTENPHSWIDEPYRSSVKASIQFLLKTNPQVFLTVSNLTTLVAMADEDIVINKHPEIFEAFLASVNLGLDGKVRFKANNEEVPYLYRKKLIDVLRATKIDGIKDSNLYLLAALTKNTYQLTTVAPRALLDMLCLRKDRAIIFRDTDIPLPPQWVTVALEELKAMIDNNGILGIKDFEVFTLISKLGRDYFLNKFKSNENFAKYIMDMIQVKDPVDNNFARIPPVIVDWVHQYVSKTTENQRHAALRKECKTFAENYNGIGLAGKYDRLHIDKYYTDEVNNGSQKPKRLEAQPNPPVVRDDRERIVDLDVTGRYPGASITPSTLTYFFARRGGGSIPSQPAAAAPTTGRSPNLFEDLGYGTAVPTGTPTSSKV